MRSALHTQSKATMQWTLVRLRKCILQLPLMTQGAELQGSTFINDVWFRGFNGRKVNHFIKWGKCVLIKVFLENKMIKRLEKLRNWAMTSFMDVPCEKTQLLFYELFFHSIRLIYNEQWSGLIRPTWWGSNESPCLMARLLRHITFC